MNQMLEVFKALIGREMGPGTPPFSQWLRGVLREVEEGALTMEFTTRPEMANPMGLLHGGVQNAILDEVIGMTSATLGGDTFYLSLNLSVDYLGKVKAGEKVIAKSKLVRQGKRIINLQCELFDEQGNLISRGTSNLLKSDIAAFPGPHSDPRKK